MKKILLYLLSAASLNAATLTVSSNVDTFLTAADYAAMRTQLALTIGTNVQAYDADLTSWALVTRGTGIDTALAVNVGSAGAPVLFNGAGGTPSSLTGTNITGTAAGLTAGVSNGLKSATTTVSVSAATAPSSGQVLTATSSTAATWQSVTGTGDVTAAAAFGTDNVLIRSDGTSKGTQATGIVVSDADAVSGIASMTVEGAVTAGSIAYNGALAADDTAGAITLTGLTAGATIAQWEAVYIGGSSTYLLADANGSGTYPARGLAVAAYSGTNAATIVTSGTVRNDAWAWTPGGTIYLSTTAGGLTQTIPSTAADKIQIIGYALTADIMMVAIGPDVGTVPTP